MIDFHFILIVSLFIYGLNFATDYEDDNGYKNNGYKNLLWKLKFWSLKYIGEYWTRPLLSCPICMSSVWTTVLYIVLIDKYNLEQWLVSVVVVAGLTRILRNFV